MDATRHVLVVLFIITVNGELICNKQSRGYSMNHQQIGGISCARGSCYFIIERYVSGECIQDRQVTGCTSPSYNDYTTDCHCNTPGCNDFTTNASAVFSTFTSKGDDDEEEDRASFSCYFYRSTPKVSKQLINCEGSCRIKIETNLWEGCEYNIKSECFNHTSDAYTHFEKCYCNNANFCNRNHTQLRSLGNEEEEVSSLSSEDTIIAPSTSSSPSNQPLINDSIIIISVESTPPSDFIVVRNESSSSKSSSPTNYCILQWTLLAASVRKLFLSR